MGLHKGQDPDYSFSEYDYHSEDETEDEQDLTRKKQVRKLIEDRLEKKRLRDEFDELDGDFDWNDYDK